jgi:hypothetical protein
MPDIHFWYAHALPENGHFAGNLSPGATKRQLKRFVASGMDCLDDDGREIVHDWRTQISVLTFEPWAEDHLGKLACMYVLAYDWPDRMRNIGDRLTEIGVSVQQLLQLPENTLDLQFIEISRPTPKSQGCWVNV